MKPHRILKNFPGNQTGNGPTEHFVEGEISHLSDWLAEVVVPAGLAEPVDETQEEEKSEGDAPSNKAKKAAPSNKAKK